MHDIHARVMNQLAEVVVRLHCFVETLLGCLYCRIQMLLIHVAHCHQAACLVTDEMQTRTADAAHTDDTTRKLVTGGYELVLATHLAQHLARHDGKECCTGRASLQK